MRITRRKQPCAKSQKDPYPPWTSQQGPKAGKNPSLYLSSLSFLFSLAVAGDRVILMTLATVIYLASYLPRHYIEESNDVIKDSLVCFVKSMKTNPCKNDLYQSFTFWYIRIYI